MALQSGRLEPVAEQAGWAKAAYLACVVVVFFGIPRQLRIPLEVIHLATESTRPPRNSGGSPSVPCQGCLLIQRRAHRTGRSKEFP
jgi:hypothetical protein